MANNRYSIKIFLILPDSPKLRQEVDSGIANSMTENRDSSFVLMRTPFTGTRHHIANRRQAGIFPSE